MNHFFTALQVSDFVYDIFPHGNLLQGHHTSLSESKLPPPPFKLISFFLRIRSCLFDAFLCKIRLFVTMKHPPLVVSQATILQVFASTNPTFATKLLFVSQHCLFHISHDCFFFGFFNIPVPFSPQII